MTRFREANIMMQTAAVTAVSITFHVSERLANRRVVDLGDENMKFCQVVYQRKRQGHMRRALSHDTVPWQSRRASYVPLGAHLDEAGQRHARALCFRPLKATRVWSWRSRGGRWRRQAMPSASAHWLGRFRRHGRLSTARVWTTSV